MSTFIFADLTSIILVLPELVTFRAEVSFNLGQLDRPFHKRDPMCDIRSYSLLLGKHHDYLLDTLYLYTSSSS